MTHRKFNEPKTAIGRYMVYTFIPKYSNNVMGFVYMGAAILIVVVGLRGLGSLVGQLHLLPDFLLDPQGAKLSPYVVLIGLLLEFSLLLILGTVTFFTPEDSGHGGHGATPEPTEKPITVSLPDFKEEVEQIKELSNEEKVMIRSFLDEFENINRRINRIQESNVEALKKMKDALSQN